MTSVGRILVSAGLALLLTAVTPRPAGGQVTEPLQVTVGDARFGFGVRPQPEVRGVEVVRGEPRLDAYGVSDDAQWYPSERWDGRYVAIDEPAPADLREVPRARWNTYPKNWLEGGRRPGR